MKKFNLTAEIHNDLQSHPAEVRQAVLEAMLIYMFTEQRPEIQGEAGKLLNSYDKVLRRKIVNSRNGKKGGAPKGNKNACKPQRSENKFNTSNSIPQNLKEMAAPPIVCQQLPEEKTKQENDLQKQVNKQAQEIANLTATIKELQKQLEAATATSQQATANQSEQATPDPEPSKAEETPKPTQEEKEIFKNILLPDIQAWQQHMQKNKFKFTETSFITRLFNLSKGNPDTAKKLIYYNIEQGYKNIFLLPTAAVIKQATTAKEKKLFRNSNYDYSKINNKTFFNKK